MRSSRRGRNSKRALDDQAERPGPTSRESGSLWPSLALRIDPPGSAQEREANAVAAHIETPESKSVTGSAETTSPDIQRPGHPLGTATREYFEPRFGHAFDNVRVHTGARASESAESLNAVAYTAGA